MADTRRVSMVLFDGFELLDAVGPIELFAHAGDRYQVELLGPTRRTVRSGQGVEVAVTGTYADAVAADIVMVPGGRGTRALVNDREFVEWLAEFGASAPLVTSVCTGAALLAASGLLDGYRATTNKAAFEWVRTQGPHVEWVAEARWVEDRNRWTSSGVAAGMDMTAALIAHLHGAEVADRVTDHIELEIHRDSTWDPFARLYGLA
ncbi:DJ-1/PfpI family protein [Microbacterium sp. RD1]|uniref:DJ-1/PfpI family protein n=1 Tax=Microbacterium sp. RD1 TaxID=3457313 RepID=UPI003FA57D3C